jgi:hypothetical protein
MRLCIRASLQPPPPRPPPPLAPNVFIWSAVACSSAFPFLFAPQDLLARDAFGNVVRFSETGAAQSQRRWCDGSLEEDLPMRGLRWGRVGKGSCRGSLGEGRWWAATPPPPPPPQPLVLLQRRGSEGWRLLGPPLNFVLLRAANPAPAVCASPRSQLFGVNFFIASQSNPWLIGVVALKRLLSPSLGRLLESEFKHRWAAAAGAAWGLAGSCCGRWASGALLTRWRPPPPPNVLQVLPAAGAVAPQPAAQDAVPTLGGRHHRRSAAHRQAVVASACNGGRCTNRHPVLCRLLLH